MSKRTTLAAIVLSVATFAGCSADVSTSKTVDTDKAEQVIGDGLSEQLGGEISVTCPDDVEAEKGKVFTCEATDPDGQKADVKVTQKDDDGNVSWEIG